MSEHSVKAGLSYGWRMLNVYGNLNWFDNYATNATSTTYRRHRTVVDAGAGFRLSPRLNFFLSARNVFDSPLLNMQKVGNNPAVVTSYQSMGTVFSLGMSGSF